MPPKAETTPLPETKPSKKRVGRESPLTDEQQAVVESFFPAWEQLLRQHKLHLGKPKDSKGRDPEPVTSWVNETVKKIRKTEGFLTDDDLKTNDEWAKVCRLVRLYFSGIECYMVDSEGRIQESPPQCFY